MIPFSDTALPGENDLPLFRLETRDAPALTKLYRQIEIRSDNYLEKMGDGENSFAHAGGMFEINDLKRNEEILSDLSNVVLGAFRDGELCAMIWYNLTGRDFPFDRIICFKGCQSYGSIIRREGKSGHLLEGKEIIVLPQAGRGLSRRFFRILLSQARENGIRYKTGEVYHVDGYRDQTGFHPCDLLNIRSYLTLQKSGGIPVGTLPQKKVEKEGIVYYITPHVLLWDLGERGKKEEET